MPECKSLAPILKYPGGKRRLAKIIGEYYEPHTHRRFVARFCGGLGDVLSLMPEKALLNDSFAALINLYQHVQQGFEIESSFSHSHEFYYRARERFNTINNPLMLPLHSYEAAELLCYLNAHCFNGLMRSNSMGGFNAPVGKPPAGRQFVFRHDFHDYRETFQKWEFTCKDFKEVELDENDFVYDDPPYDGISDTAKFNQYGSGEPFTWERQEELAESLAKLSGPTLASNHASDRIIDLYTKLGADIRIIEVTRCINSKTSARKNKVPEILASWRI